MASLRKAQVPIRGRGSNKCPHHAGKEVIFVCDDCGELVCSKCVSTIHRKHAVDDINEIIPQVKVTIQDFVNKAENSYLPKLNGELKNLDDKMSRNKNHFKDVISQITKQNENLKRELDKITNNLIALCREVENENDDILKRHRMELKSNSEELHARVLELKDTLQSGTNTQVYDTSREIPSNVTILALPFVQDMDFKPTSFSQDQLEKLVGKIFQTTGDSRTQIKSSVGPNQQGADVASEIENYKTSSQPEISANKDGNSGKLSNINVETFINLRRFTHERGIHSVRATSSSQAWARRSDTLQLLTDSGKKLKTVKMEVDIVDFCISPSTGDIWFCSDTDNSVRKVSEDNRSTMFYINSVPLSICMSADGNVLVGMERQVIKYTQSGQILCKLSSEWKLLIKQIRVVKYPERISQCPVTRNIAVLDLDYKHCGGEDKKHVSILSEDFHLLCRYYGHDMKSFCPRDVCYSDTGDIYIADSNNGSIQQISGKGEFIQTVYTDNEPARCLCVQSNGNIWAGFGGVFVAKKIIILQKQ